MHIQPCIVENTFVSMNINRGEIVKRRLKQAKWEIGDVSELLGIHRNTLPLWLEKDDLDYKTIIEIEKVTGLNFSDEITELKRMRINVQGNLVVMEPAVEYNSMTKDELKDALLTMQGKLITVQEENIELRKELNKKSN